MRFMSGILQERLIRMQARGVLICPCEKNFAAFELLDKAGIPYVALDSVPDNLRGALPPLLQELGLPHDLCFEDLTAALRALDGPLPDAGVRILLLDEWRRLHGRKRG